MKYGLIVLGVFFIAGALLFVPHTGTAHLEECLQYEKTARNECVFSTLERILIAKGIESTIAAFIEAHTLFPGELEEGCHSAMHRLGDIAYYRLYFAQADIGPDDVPMEGMLCNGGFVHGITEHLIQNNPDAEFIADTCRVVGEGEHPLARSAMQTCFHSAGHGLFRAQAERVSNEEWGVPAAFVTHPADVCARLPDVDPNSRFNCTTGVSSIYIQMALANEFGLRDPDPDNRFAVCDVLAAELHEPCYFVRALMVAERESYDGVLERCVEDKAFAEKCVRGAIVGMFVDGIHDESFARAAAFCSEPLIAERALRDYCHDRILAQLDIEYAEEYAPDCEVFPEPYREQCMLKTS